MNRHDDHIRSYSIIRDKPIGGVAFTMFLELLVANKGDDLLRVKGIVRGPRARRTLLQAVRRTVTSERIMQSDADSWSTSTFVLIGTGLPAEALTSSFHALPVCARR